MAAVRYKLANISGHGIDQWRWRAPNIHLHCSVPITAIWRWYGGGGGGD